VAVERDREAPACQKKCEDCIPHFSGYISDRRRHAKEFAAIISALLLTTRVPALISECWRKASAAQAFSDQGAEPTGAAPFKRPY